jgi:hypothetical protein
VMAVRKVHLKEPRSINLPSHNRSQPRQIRIPRQNRAGVLHGLRKALQRDFASSQPALDRFDLGWFFMVCFSNWNNAKDGSSCWSGWMGCISRFWLSSADRCWLKTRGYIRRTLCHGITHAFGDIVGRFLKLLYPLPEPFRELRQFFRAEQNQNNREDQNDFSAAEIEEG